MLVLRFTGGGLNPLTLKLRDLIILSTTTFASIIYTVSLTLVPPSYPAKPSCPYNLGTPSRRVLAQPG